MVVLDVKLNNFYSFRDFHMNLTYPKKIVGSCINNEHLKGRPNFRYKKINIIMGANASGKTTFGHTLMKIFNFIDKKNYELITEIIGDPTKEASFTLDLASEQNIFYRIICKITPTHNEKYTSENVKLEIRKENIWLKDSYESCVKRIDDMVCSYSDNYSDELEKMEELYWLFEHPEDTDRTINFPKDDKKFPFILENILKALDPSICSVEKSQEVDNAYVIRLQNKAVILQDGE